MAKRAGEGPAIGIDLGTTNSCVAVYQHGKVEVIVNGQGYRITPSFVAFTDSDLLVGEAAFNQSARNFLNTIFDAKRLIGRIYSDPVVQEDMKMWSFRVEPTADNRPAFAVAHEGDEKRFSPEDISSMVLSHMKAVAEAYLGTTVRNAVVTVPAYFNNSQRQATKEAAVAAGLNIVGIINEPTAAAMAYSLDRDLHGKRRNNKKKNALVFDLGGGTFDVSLLSVGGGDVNVIATAGDTHLGGADFDSRLVEFCAERFRSKHGVDPRRNPKSLRRLRAACERAKRILSFMVETTVDVEYLYGGEDFQCFISAAKFEELNMDLFTKCISLVNRCLEDANVDKAAVDEVVLVGGSTRIPKVQELLKGLFHVSKLCHGVNPDEAVAAGAAIHAASLAGDETQSFETGGLLFSDVTPLPLGINVAGGKMSVLIPKNTPIPTTMERTFTTSIHNQCSVRFHVYEGEGKLTRDNKHLGDFELLGIPPAPRGVPRVVVRFDVDEDGLLAVTAQEGDGTRNHTKKVKVAMKGRWEKEVERRLMAAGNSGGSSGGAEA